MITWTQFRESQSYSGGGVHTGKAVRETTSRFYATRVRLGRETLRSAFKNIDRISSLDRVKDTQLTYKGNPQTWEPKATAKYDLVQELRALEKEKGQKFLPGDKIAFTGKKDEVFAMYHRTRGGKEWDVFRDVSRGRFVSPKKADGAALL